MFYFLQVILEGRHNQKTKHSVSVLLISIGSLFGIILLLLLILVLWKVRISVLIYTLVYFYGLAGYPSKKKNTKRNQQRALEYTAFAIIFIWHLGTNVVFMQLINFNVIWGNDSIK